MEKINVKVKLTEEDYRNWHLSRVFSLRFKIINVFIILLMAGTLAVALCTGRGFWSFLKSFLPVIIFYGVYLILMPLLVYYNVKKIFESDKLIQEEQSYEFDEGGFTIYASYGNSWIDWEKIFRATVDKKYVSFFTSRVKAFLLPRKYFTSEEQAKAVINLIKEKIEKKKLKISI
jgi:hypothetical protein